MTTIYNWKKPKTPNIHKYLLFLGNSFNQDVSNQLVNDPSVNQHTHFKLYPSKNNSWPFNNFYSNVTCLNIK